jgi:GNAT superfamily N-acetyltransferase
MTFPAIRGVEANDLDACHAVSLATGLAGRDASHLYRDRRMMGHIYIAPYVLLEPGLTLVAEDDAGVAGFVAGALDTAAWEDRLERDWWPSLRKQYADPSGVPSADWTADQRRAFMIHHPAPTPPAVVARYPAHLHMNLLPRLQRRGIGSKLLEAWLDIACRRGASAFHIGVNRENRDAVQFWRARAFETVTPDRPSEGRTLWMGRDITTKCRRDSTAGNRGR